MISQLGGRLYPRGGVGPASEAVTISGREARGDYSAAGTCSLMNGEFDQQYHVACLLAVLAPGTRRSGMCHVVCLLPCSYLEQDVEHVSRHPLAAG